jgi:hypothetical protein
MDICHYFLKRIIQKYGLAVGHLDHQKFPLKRRHQGITYPRAVEVTGPMGIRAFGAHHRFNSMNLPDKEKLSGFQTCGNDRPILLYITRIIADTKAGIQTAIRSIAKAAFAGKNSVLDFRKPGQVWKLEK